MRSSGRPFATRLHVGSSCIRWYKGTTDAKGRPWHDASKYLGSLPNGLRDSGRNDVGRGSRQRCWDSQRDYRACISRLEEKVSLRSGLGAWADRRNIKVRRSRGPWGSSGCVGLTCITACIVSTDGMSAAGRLSKGAPCNFSLGSGSSAQGLGRRADVGEVGMALSYLCIARLSRVAGHGGSREVL